MKGKLTYSQFIKATANYSIADIEAFTAEAGKHFELFPESYATRFAGQYIFYYPTARYLHVDKRLAQIAGRSIDYIKDNGLGSKEPIWYEPDQFIHNEKIFSANLDYFKALPPKQHNEHLVSCNYRIKKYGELRNILQESHFIRSADDGMPLMVLGFVSDVSHLWNDDRIVHSILDKHGKRISRSYYANSQGSVLTDREIEILKLSRDGYKNFVIADKLNISYKTVDNTKQNINRKLNTQSTMGAIQEAIKQNIISK